jgi:small subunit ribosomal protein S15
MYLTSDIKKDIFKNYGKSEKDTGSAEGQIALFTHRINHLTGHLKIKPKDKSSERSLVLMVGKRKALLDYLKKNNIERYRAILKKLDIRK